MTSLVATGYELKLSYGQHRTAFRNPRGLKYYYSFQAVRINPAPVNYEKSINGVSWLGGIVEVITFGGVNGNAHCFDVKIYDDGSQLEVWVVAIGYDSDSAVYQTKYRYGTIADADSTITWNAQQTINADIDFEVSGAFGIALARTDNGRIVVAFTEDDTIMGKDYRLTKLIGSDGDGAAPNWLGETIIDDPSGNSNNQNKALLRGGLESYSSSYPNRVLFYWRVPEGSATNTYEVIAATPDWNGAAFSGTTTYSISSSSSAAGVWLSGLVDDSDYGHFLYAESNALLYHSKTNAQGGVSTGVSDTTVLSNDARCTLTLDTGPATDLLYAFYNDGSALVDWSYKTSPVDVISWSSEKKVSFHENVHSLTSWNRVIENSLHLGVEYDTDNVAYNEHPVYKALSTTLADLEFPDQNYYLGPHDL